MLDCQPLRLRPGVDLRRALEDALPPSVTAAFVLAGVGSLRGARIRLAGAEEPLTLAGDLEILSLSGTLSVDGAHLHISVADAQGRVLGGHLAPGAIVGTTAEVLLARLPMHSFLRQQDPATGYAELVIHERSWR